MKKTPSSLLLILLFVSFFSLAWAEEKEPYLVQKFNQKPGGNLEVQTSGGSITVTGNNKNEVTVFMIVKDRQGNSDKATIEELLKNYRIEIRKENNTISATAEKKDKSWSGRQELSISFRVEVPSKTACNLNTSGGSIAVTNVKGETHLNTSGGSISMAKYDGKLTASTSGGSISLTEAEGTFKVRTSGGSINLKQVAGDVDAQTSGGSISADITKLGKYLTLSTAGGSVNATIPKGQGLDLDLSGNRVKTDLANFKGKSNEYSVKGSVNGGGIPVKLSTSGGTTQLNYRM